MLLSPLFRVRVDLVVVAAAAAEVLFALLLGLDLEVGHSEMGQVFEVVDLLAEGIRAPTDLDR